MNGFIDLLFHPLSNMIMTILAGISALYWLMTMITGDFLGDIDIDADFGVEVDSEGVDASSESPSFFSKALEYINVGKVPFMVILSTFKFVSWIITLVSSVAFGFDKLGWKSALLLIPIFFIAYFLTKWITKPLIKVYKSMGYNGEETYDLIGRVAKMRSTISGSKIGSAELVINKDVIRIQVKSKNNEEISYGSDVMIVDESKHDRIFWVVPEVNLDNIK